jgi:hypothetical protein
MPYDEQPGMLPGQKPPASKPAPSQQSPAQPGQRAGLLRAPQAAPAPASGAAPAQTPAGTRAAAPAPARASKDHRWSLGGGSDFWQGIGERRTARPTLPSPQPLGRRTRFLLQLVTMLIFLGAIWFILGHAGNGGPSLTPNATTAINRQPTTGAPGSAAPTASPGKSGPLSAEQVTAMFLQSFFSWDGAESDQTYITGWAKFVAPREVATLDTAAPRLLLDSGNDSASQSLAPTIPDGSAQVQGQNAQVQAAWTIQVAPPSAEQVIWQTRQIQATVWLTQSGTTWFVTNLTWQSNGA